MKLKVNECKDIKWDLDGVSLKHIIDFLSKYPQDATIDIGTEDDYGREVAYVTLNISRAETDEEESTRLIEAETRKASIKAQEEKEYQRLKAIFESK